jgi:hypothetical protein
MDCTIYSDGRMPLHIVDIPEEIHGVIFSNLTKKRISSILPLVCKSFEGMATNYKKEIIAPEEEYWKQRCLSERYASWGDTEEVIEVAHLKSCFTSWKKDFHYSIPSYLLCKQNKYYEKIQNSIFKIYGKENIGTFLLEYPKPRAIFSNKGMKILGGVKLLLEIKNKIFGLTEKESKNLNKLKEIEIIKEEEQGRIKKITNKIEKLYCPKNLERLLVTMIGKERFEQIPVYNKLTPHPKVTLIDDFILASRAGQNLSIRRGNTPELSKFIFMQTFYLDSNGKKDSNLSNYWMLRADTRLEISEFIIYADNATEHYTSKIYKNGLSPNQLQDFQRLLFEGTDGIQCFEHEWDSLQ